MEIKVEEAIENIKKFYGSSLFSEDAGVVTKSVETLIHFAQTHGSDKSKFCPHGYSVPLEYCPDCSKPVEPGWEKVSIELAEHLGLAWVKYCEFFGQPPHGTQQQIRAMFELAGFPDYIRSLLRPRLRELDEEQLEALTLLAEYYLCNSSDPERNRDKFKYTVKRDWSNLLGYSRFSAPKEQATEEAVAKYFYNKRFPNENEWDNLPKEGKKLFYREANELLSKFHLRKEVKWPEKRKCVCVEDKSEIVAIEFSLTGCQCGAKEFNQAIDLCIAAHSGLDKT